MTAIFASVATLIRGGLPFFESVASVRGAKKAICAAVHMSESTFDHYRSTIPPSYARAQQLADLLGVSVEELKILAKMPVTDKGPARKCNICRKPINLGRLIFTCRACKQLQIYGGITDAYQSRF